MAGVPSLCSHCGFLFNSTAFALGNGRNITISGGSEPCPRCQRYATILGGTFNAYRDQVEIVSAPPLTHAALSKLRTIAEMVKAQEISPEQAITQADQIAPGFGKLMRRFLELGGPSILIALIALYLQYSDGASSDEFQRRALEMMERGVTSIEQLERKVNIQEENAAKRAEPKPVTKGARSKLQNRTRFEKNKKRRQELQKRRAAFNPRSH